MLRSVLKVLSSTAMIKVLLGVVGVTLIRFMTPREFADLTFLIAVGATISQIIASSINRLYIVGHERLKLDESVSGLLALQLILVLLSGAILALVYEPKAVVMLPLLLLIFGNCAVKFVQTHFQQQGEFGRFAKVEIYRTLLIVLLVAVLVLSLGDAVQAWQVVTLQGAAATLVFIVFWCFVWDRPRGFNLRPLREVVRFVACNNYKFMFGYFIVMALFSQADLLALRLLGTDDQLASYGAGLRYYSLVNLGLASVKIVLFPTIKKAGSRQEVDDIYAEYRKLIALVVPVLLLAILVAGHIIPVLDGSKYPSSIAVFRILAVSAGVSFLLSPHSELLHVNEQFGVLLVILLTSLIAKVVLTVVLLGPFGESGVAMATTLSFAVVNVSIFVRSRRVLGHYR